MDKRTKRVVDYNGHRWSFVLCYVRDRGPDSCEVTEALLGFVTCLLSSGKWVYNLHIVLHSHK
jgi:hypothetical protein